MILLAVMVLVGCDKDEAFDLKPIESMNLHEYLAQANTLPQSNRLFPVAGNHPMFFQNEDTSSHILVNRVDQASDYRLYLTDTLAYRDSLETYDLAGYDFVDNEDGVFGAFEAVAVKRDCFARVICTTADSQYVSEAITVRSATLKTDTIDGISVTAGFSGKTQVSWNSVPGADDYLVVFRGNNGDVVGACFERKAAFTYYDLRHASVNLTPRLYDPELISKARYGLEVFAVTDRGWVLAYGQKQFQAF
mgnify:CR=1 FL=1